MLKRTGSWNLIAGIGLVFVVATFLAYAFLNRSEERALEQLLDLAGVQETRILRNMAGQASSAFSEAGRTQDISTSGRAALSYWAVQARKPDNLPPQIQPIVREVAPVLVKFEQAHNEYPPAVSAVEQQALRMSFEKVAAELRVSDFNSGDQLKEDFIARGQAKNAIFFVILTVASGLIIMTLLQNNWLLDANGKITESAQRYSRLARHDGLTDLPNRLYFEEVLAEALSGWDQTETLSVLALDLDGFKGVNDTLGHDGGDALLRSIASRLKNIVRNLDGRNCVARTGGDEFVILLYLQTGIADPRRIASRICSELQRPFETEYGHIKVGGSVGYTLARADGLEADVLLKEADLALMEAKASGPGLSRPYNCTMMEKLKRRLKIEADLGSAIEANHIRAFYQPQFDLQTGCLIGAEALARWKHAELGQIWAVEFIPIAEANGDIVRLGKLIFEQVCAEVAQMPQHLTVTINVSLAQLMEADFPTFVRDVLAKTGVSPARIILEFREHTLLVNPHYVRQAIVSLQSLGVKISLGDFGTGTARIQDVLQVRWNEIKVDKSLSGLEEPDGEVLPIVNLIQHIGGHVQSSLLVGGIETELQKTRFSEAGFAHGQGYFYSEALPKDEFEKAYLMTG